MRSRSLPERFADQVRLTMSAQHYLTEPQERTLLLGAIERGLSLDAARAILAETVAKRRGARETTLDHDIEVTLATIAGDRGWLSRTSFDHATGLYRRLSGGAVCTAEARSRVKELMVRRG